MTDFGLTSEVEAGIPKYSSEARGSDGYRAPELLENRVFNKEVDVWSLGCILFELATGRQAFDSDFLVSKHCYDTKSVLSFDGINNQACISTLVLKMLEADPSRRPQISVLLQDFSNHYQQGPGECRYCGPVNTAASVGINQGFPNNMCQSYSRNNLFSGSK